MQSNGGLVDPEGFRGLHSVLSGPAGGVVGLAAAGAASGREHVIGLDMGGTSTDVSLYAGALPRRFVTEIDGVRLQAPMLDIHTIAAGGGSIVRHADGRLQVGPDSAGADPGPACYRRGGPATVTDCNVVLGRIRADRFPQVFGPTGDAPLDPAASQARLAAIVEAVATAGGPRYTVEALAAAFLEVAVSKMANAIRELALRHGEDAGRFTLVPFGGAAGQHACAVADALGIDTLLLHPLAGVLSAWGIGLARRRCLRRRSVECTLDAAGVAQALAALDALEHAARAELLRQGIADADIELRRSAELRIAGSDTALEVPWQPVDGLRTAFLAAHRRLYGFSDDAARIVIATVTVEAAESGDAGDVEPAAAAPEAHGPQDPQDSRVPADPASPTHAPQATATTRAWIDGGWREVAMHRREELSAGRVVTGPALLSEPGSTALDRCGLGRHGRAQRQPRAAPGRRQRDGTAALGPGCPTRCDSRCSADSSCTWPSRWASCCARRRAR